MCTNLYRGYGYSGAFCENMSEKVQWLKTHPDEKIQLVCEPDMICEKCPNLKEGDFCANGDNHVCEKDKSLLQELHLVENEFYTYSELMQAADEYLSEEVFMRSCENCGWYYLQQHWRESKEINESRMFHCGTCGNKKN